MSEENISQTVQEHVEREKARLQGQVEEERRKVAQLQLQLQQGEDQRKDLVAQNEKLHARVEALQAELPLYDAISQFRSDKFEARMRRLRYKLQIASRSYWDTKFLFLHEFGAMFQWGPKSELKDYSNCIPFLRTILPAPIRDSEMTVETITQQHQPGRLSGTLGDIAIRKNGDMRIIIELKKLANESRFLYQSVFSLIIFVHVFPDKCSPLAVLTDLHTTACVFTTKRKTVHGRALEHKEELLKYMSDAFDGSGSASASGASGASSASSASSSNGSAVDSTGSAVGSIGSGGIGDESGTDALPLPADEQSEPDDDDIRGERLSCCFDNDFDFKGVLEQAASLPEDERFEYVYTVSQPHFFIE